MPRSKASSIIIRPTRLEVYSAVKVMRCDWKPFRARNEDTSINHNYDIQFM